MDKGGIWADRGGYATSPKREAAAFLFHERVLNNEIEQLTSDNGDSTTLVCYDPTEDLLSETAHTVCLDTICAGDVARGNVVELVAGDQR